MDTHEGKNLRNPFKTVVVTGIPGVGKTTVLSIIGSKTTGINVKIVNFGDYMYRAATREGFIKTRDDIRHISHRKQLELQKRAAETIVADASKELGPDGVLIIDTHAVVKTSSGYWPGLPQHVVDVLKPDSIVIIEAPPEEIVNRQQKDGSRYRKDISRVDVVNELMEMARKAAMASATLTASSVYIVENPPGKPEKAAEEIIKLLDKL